MLKPLNDNIVVELAEAEKKTASGIILSGDSGAPTHGEGFVLAAGPGKTSESGQVLPVAVQAGQKVIFSSYEGLKVKHEGKDLVILSAADILAVVE